MQENERVFNLEQKQRNNERMIRKYKRESAVLKAGEFDYEKQKNLATAWSKRNDTLNKQNSDVLKRNYLNELLAKNYKSIVKSTSKIVSIKDEFIKNATTRLMIFRLMRFLIKKHINMKFQLRNGLKVILGEASR